MSGPDYLYPRDALRDLKAAYAKVLDGARFTKISVQIADGTAKILTFRQADKNGLRIEIRRLTAALEAPNAS